MQFRLPRINGRFSNNINVILLFVNFIWKWAEDKLNLIVIVSSLQ